MDGKSARSDRAVAQIAARQHGVVSIGQLRKVGLSEDAVRARVLAGRFHRIHQGVYAVGHRAISREGRWTAAVLAIGGGPSAAAEPLAHWGAAVSHRSAVELWGLLAMQEGPVDVSVPGEGGRRQRAGIRIHRSLSLLPAHVTLRSGIPVTTPARTISDLRQAVAGRRSGALSQRELRRAIRQAEVLGLPIEEIPGRDRTRSDLERDFLRLCRRHGLPRPEVNVRIGRDLVDFLWRARWLIVETDSYVYHRGRVAFEDDHDRDVRLRDLGFDLIRISDKQVDLEPERVAETLVTALRVEPDAGRRKNESHRG